MQRAIIRLGAPIALFLAAIAVSWPGIHGELFFDSIPNIAANRAIQITDLSPSSLLGAALSFSESSIGRPIPMLTFAVDWYFAGPNPFLSKLVNLLIHGINAVLVFFLVRRMLRLHLRLANAGSGVVNPETVAFLVALFWAIAPIHGFTVLYVVQRMVLLAALFTLVALHSYLSMREAASRGASASVIIGYLALLALATLASLGCKETAILIPFYIAVTEVFLFRFQGLGRMRPLFMAALSLAVVTPIATLAYMVSNNPSGIYAGYDLRPFGPGERLLTQTRVLAMYLRNVIVPDYGQLHFFYDNLPISRSLTEPVTTALSAGLLVSLAAAGLFLRRRLPLFGFAVFWFLAGQSLEASFWPLELVFWHRNYLPALGPLVAVAFGLAWLMRRPGLTRTSGIGLLGLVLALSGIQSWLIATDWRDRIAMARAEVSKNPGSARASQYYGRMAAISAGVSNDPALIPEASKYFSRALDQDPRTLHPLTGLLYLAVINNHGEVPPALGEMQRRAAVQVLEISEIATFDSLLKLYEKFPARFDLVDVLAVFDAAASNPRLVPQQRASALEHKAQLLSYAGQPPSLYLPPLRQAVSLFPDSLQYRSLLFRTLVDVGELDEAAAMLSQPFSSMDRLRDPLIARYETALRDGLKHRADAR